MKIFSNIPTISRNFPKFFLRLKNELKILTNIANIFLKTYFKLVENILEVTYF